MSLFKNEFTSRLCQNSEQYIFSSLDQDGDGKISYHEFIKGVSEKSKILDEANLKVAFDVLDLDENGYITLAELRHSFTFSNLNSLVALDVGDDFWNKIFAEVDQDGNGQISFDEFCQNMALLLKSDPAEKTCY